MSWRVEECYHDTCGCKAGPQGFTRCEEHDGVTLRETARVFQRERDAAIAELAARDAQVARLRKALEQAREHLAHVFPPTVHESRAYVVIDAALASPPRDG